MKRLSLFRIFSQCLSAILIASVIAACGGSGGSSQDAQQQASVYRGPITGLGSVIVNGVRFSTIGADVSDDEGTSLNHQDLSMGAMVEVVGVSNDSLGTGTASKIELLRGIQGAITAINSSSLTVLDQQIVLDQKTVYKNVSNSAALIVGDTVEAYGYFLADGRFYASLIEKKAITHLQIIGQISQLDASLKRFTVQNKSVDYSTATVQGVLANGATVKVKTQTMTQGTVLIADSVKVKYEYDSLNTYQGSTVKIAGFVRTAPLNGLMTVADFTVDVSQAQLSGLNSIAVGDQVEIKGVWNGNVLLASSVEKEGYHATIIGGHNELYGVITQFVSNNEFTVNGVLVNAAGATGLQATLQVGTYVELKGNMQGNVFVATKIELDHASTPSGGYYEMYGMVSNYVSLAQFTVNGMTVDASNAVIEHPERGPIANNRYVEVKGAQSASGVFIATKVEIKN